jgi:hypothetical protein
MAGLSGAQFSLGLSSWLGRLRDASDQLSSSCMGGWICPTKVHEGHISCLCRQVNCRSDVLSKAHLTLFLRAKSTPAVPRPSYDVPVIKPLRRALAEIS